MQIELSERQRQTVAAAMTILAVFVIVVAVGALLFLVAMFVNRFSSVLLPIAVAGILALVFNPYFEWLRRRMPGPVAIVLLFLSLLLPLVAFFWFFGALVLQQLSDLVDKAPEAWEKISAAAQERWPQVQAFLERHGLVERIREAAQGQANAVAQGVQLLGAKMFTAGAAVFRGIAALLSWAVMPVYLIFFLLAQDKKLADLESYLPFLKSETRGDLVFLFGEFVRILVSFFRGQIIIAFFQGVLYAAGFSLVGLRYGFVLGLTLGFLNIIPYLGSIVGLGVTIPLAYFQQDGGLGTAIAVVVIFTVVQLIESYLLTPRIMGDRTGLHPVVIIVAVFFWGSALGGIMGMILAIPLTAFLVVFWRLAKEKYIKELV